MKKLNYNAVYISFSVYNTDVDIHHVNMSFHYNDVGITLECQQIYNCCSQMKLCT